MYRVGSNNDVILWMDFVDQSHKKGNKRDSCIAMMKIFGLKGRT